MKREPVILTAEHVTTYTYEWPVSWASHVGHLSPRDTSTQQVLSSEITIDPAPTWKMETRDFYGNSVLRFSLEDHHEALCVTARMAVRLVDYLPPEKSATPPWEDIVRRAQMPETEGDIEANSFIFGSRLAPTSSELARFGRQSFSSGRPILEALLDLNYRINKGFRFDAEATNVTTPVETVLQRRHGVCQDFAHLMIASLRSIGLPARYVSGYIRTGNEAEEGLIGSDASHAWVSVFCGDAGWIDVDPTNNCIPSLEHVTVAWGMDFEDVSPLKGVLLGGGRHVPDVGVRVTSQPAS
jgi:transglutaminase-like putative cysteine protease